MTGPRIRRSPARRSQAGAWAWSRVGERSPHLPDTGSVTAEMALTLPLLVVVTLIAIWGVTVAAAQVACVDAARAGARAVARGERLPAVQAAVRAAAPPGAGVSIRRASGLATVEVRFTARPGPSTGLPGLVLRERAVAVTEPGVGEAPMEPESSGRPAVPAVPAGSARPE